MICFNCNKDMGLLEPITIGRRENCQNCGADAHVCKNCEFYDARVYNECREPTAERVIEKDRSNFCDQFKPKIPKSAAEAAKVDALTAAKALFGKK